MKSIFKYTAAIVLAGASVTTTAMPSQAEGYARKAATVRAGTGTGAAVRTRAVTPAVVRTRAVTRAPIRTRRVIGATAAGIATGGYYYGPGSSYGWPGYAYGLGYAGGPGYASSGPGYAYGADYAYAPNYAYQPGFLGLGGTYAYQPGSLGIGGSYAYESAYAYGPTYAYAPALPLTGALAAAATAPLAVPFEGAAAYAYGPAYNTSAECWQITDSDRGFGYFGACAAPQPATRVQNTKRNQ